MPGLGSGEISPYHGLALGGMRPTEATRGDKHARGVTAAVIDESPVRIATHRDRSEMRPAGRSHNHAPKALWSRAKNAARRGGICVVGSSNIMLSDKWESPAQGSAAAKGRLLHLG